MQVNNELMLKHRKYITYQANKYPYHMREDLIQEGYYGLMRALQNFNPDKNVKLITYAIYYIKDYMLRHYLKYKDQLAEFIDNQHTMEVDMIALIYQQQVLHSLPKALKQLDQRQHEIIVSRYLNNDQPIMTLKDLGKYFRVSEERIRQIEVQAIQRLRLYVEDCK